MPVEKKLYILDKMIRGSLYALIFFLPISIALVGTWAGITIFLFLVKRCVTAVALNKIRGWRVLVYMFTPPPVFFNIPLGIYIAACLVSVLLSHYHHLGFVAFVGKILRGVFLYAAFLESFTEIRYINNFIFVWITSAFVTGLSGLSQYFGGYDFLRHTQLTDGRISSSLRQANDLGAYIVAVCPVIVVLLLHWKICKHAFMAKVGVLWGSMSFIRAYILMAGLVLMACLGLTMSRASWIAFFAALVLAGLYQKKNIRLIFLVIMVFTVLFMPLMVKTRDVSLISDRVRIQQEGMKNTSQSHGFFSVEYAESIFRYTIGMGRNGYWREAMGVIYDYPVFGAGLNSYSKIASNYRINWGGYPHNSYLQLTAELGFVGLGAFLWMMFVLFRDSFKFIHNNRGIYAQCLLLAAVVGLFAILIQSFFDTTFYSVQLSVLIWLIIAVIVAVQKVHAHAKLFPSAPAVDSAAKN